MWDKLKIEFFKIRKNRLFIAFLSIPFIIFISVLMSENRIPLYQSFFGVNYSTAFQYIFLQRLSLLQLALIVFLCYNYLSLEVKHKCYNIIFTSPGKKIASYSAKITLLITYVTINIVSSYLILWCASLFFSKISAPSAIPFLYVWAIFILLVVFQFFTAHLTRNLVSYMLLFIILFAFSVTYNGDYKIYNPYYYIKDSAYSILPHISTFKDIDIIIVSISIFYILGAISFNRVTYGKKRKSILF